ncbi:uncharacterized protein LOC130695156 [Daphnia carinata]|uniref:uncharacterized protein LOC130695156 n=1 Tax=Daphnia carinata TaxID=120202 RepID=UPI0025800D60|nr:uncharacterized protein LOC130695156 [Daphnia carinata]
MNMAQMNQPTDHVVGFANPRFVLMNGSYWNSNVTRRCIQGQACLEEFRDILLEWFQDRMKPKEPIYRHPDNEPTHLKEKGSLEVLKFAHFSYYYLANGAKKSHNPTNFKKAMEILKEMRNQLTHEVLSWKITDFTIFLEAMKNASNSLVESGHHNDALKNRLEDFISKCKKEIDNIKDFPHLY